MSVQIRMISPDDNSHIHHFFSHWLIQRIVINTLGETSVFAMRQLFIICLIRFIYSGRHFPLPAVKNNYETPPISLFSSNYIVKYLIKDNPLYAESENRVRIISPTRDGLQIDIFGEYVFHTTVKPTTGNLPSATSFIFSFPLTFFTLANEVCNSLDTTVK